ncbi:MAG: HNH endonuclease [Terracidiphilus sp.]|nr:HNH endonuclease [Terracidiphilus sp.]
MPKKDGWSREQLVVALKLYCEMPFGKMHSRNPEIIHYAKMINRSPSALAMKLTNFASLDPEIRSTGRKGLRGTSQADRDIWNEMTSDWDLLASEIIRAEHYYSCSPSFDEGEEKSAEIPVCYAGGTRSVQIEARIGQGFFRRSVLSAYEFKCCITGLAVPELLVASHIVPWRADPANRLNPKNGLCLSAIHDRAFDLGLIAISDDLRILISNRLRSSGVNSYIGHTFRSYADKTIALPEKFPPDASFLKYHRENVFRG